MLDFFKEIFPVEAILPVIGGLALWFVANLVFIGPEMIGPRLKDIYYAPACQRVVAEGTRLRAEEEKTLLSRFEAELQDRAKAARRRAREGAQAFFGLYGPEGQRFWNKWGNDVGDSASSLAETRIAQEVEAQRDQFMTLVREEKRKARAGIVHQTADAYCGCVIDEALGDRFDLATFTASLRLYKSPSIRNIESGAIFSRESSCGTMPIL